MYFTVSVIFAHIEITQNVNRNTKKSFTFVIIHLCPNPKRIHKSFTKVHLCSIFIFNFNVQLSNSTIDIPQPKEVVSKVNDFEAAIKYKSIAKK